MSEAEALRSFAVALLADLGAEVRDDGRFLWLSVPDAAQSELELPAQACLTLDPDRIGEFGAELVAPGSYVLERLLALATRRGRWDVARLQAATEGWAEDVLRGAPGVTPGSSIEILERFEEPLAAFAFRTALISDEKREAFHLIAATVDGAESWPAPWPPAEDGLTSTAVPGYAPDLVPAYRRAQAVLEACVRTGVEAFQKAALAALEEEVRRIFRYFDGTVAQVREAEPDHADDVVRAIGAERDRRLAEALERFEPHASASLCSVRVALVPAVRAAVRMEGGGRREVRVDAWTRTVRGLPEAVTEGARVRPRGRPR